MTLTELFSGIANAIRAKTGGTAQIPAENFPTAIAGIPTGGTDTSDATATASDISLNKTAYVNGEKITGEVDSLPSIYISTTNPSAKETSGVVCMNESFSARTMIEPGGMIEFQAPYSDFGDATAADVAAGKTFTSAAGFQAVGTAIATSGYTRKINGTFTSNTGQKSYSIDLTYENITPKVVFIAPYSTKSSPSVNYIGSFFYDFDTDKYTLTTEIGTKVSGFNTDYITFENNALTLDLTQISLSWYNRTYYYWILGDSKE